MKMHTINFETTPYTTGDKEIEISGGEAAGFIRVLVDFDDLTGEEAAFIKGSVVPAIEAIPVMLQTLMSAEMTFRQYALEHTQKAGETNDPAEAAARMAKAQANIEKANLMKAAIRTAGAL